MKKIIIFISLIAMAFTLCACSQGEDGSVENVSSSPIMYEDSDGTLVYNDNASEVDEGSLVTRNGDNVQVSAPENSISLDKAEEMLDSCAFEDLYLFQSVKDYQKYYFGTVSYCDSMYYSFDFYIEKDGKRVFAGTNCLVACDGTEILKKDWTGTYVTVQQNKASGEKSPSELYKSAKVMPNDALLTLTKFSNSQLGLEYELLTYTFEGETEIQTVKSIKCYKFTPKLNYTNSVKMLSPYYITVDGTNRVFTADKENDGEYIEIK
ncbi:MAG: hypothetical protein PUG48_06285 [Clostridia bacterium]|nr:hypothetical protein [Clostridia bacterium]